LIWLRRGKNDVSKSKKRKKLEARKQQSMMADLEAAIDAVMSDTQSEPSPLPDDETLPAEDMNLGVVAIVGGAVWGAIEKHCQELIQRAKRERIPREAKWRLNALTAAGEFAGGNSNEQKADWDSAEDGHETMRIARQKVVAAKTALGDAIYRNNRVPFSLMFSNISDYDDPATLEKLRLLVDKQTYTAAVPAAMRTAIEDAASYGESWIRGGIEPDGYGGLRTVISAVSPWQMYFDEAGTTELANAEYVIRKQRLSPFEVGRMVADAPPWMYDLDKVKAAVAGATAGPRDESDLAAQEDGRSGSPSVEWWEVWAQVPASLFKAESLVVADGENIFDWVRVMAVVAGSTMVAAVIGDDVPVTPFYRSEWDRDRMQPLPQGIYDAMARTQDMVTGAVRAWAANLKQASKIILAGHRYMVRQDATEIIKGVEFIDLDPDVRDVREAIQQFELQPMTAGLTQAIEILMEFGDLESGIPRVQQGTQPASTSTAFELRQRLLASGKYLNEIVRRHDDAIRWVIRFYLQVLEMQGVLDRGSAFTVVPQGFATYEDLVRRLDGLLRLIGLAAGNQRVDAMIDWDTLVKEVARADDLDVGKVFLSIDKQREQAEAAAQSEERALAMEDARASVRLKQARAAKDEASAQQAMGQIQLNRAKFIKDVEATTKAASEQRGIATR
jgi:hypothetical protein